MRYPVMQIHTKYNNVAMLLLQEHWQDAHATSLCLEPVGQVSNGWQAWCQTYSYLQCCRASKTISWYL